MEATIQTSDLKSVMAVVSRGTSNRTSISILQNVAVIASAGRVTLYAHDGECQISMSTEADVVTDGSVLINGLELMDLLKVAKGKTVTISAVKGKQYYQDDELTKTSLKETEFWKDTVIGVKVETGPMTRKMQTMDIDDFPFYSTGIVTDLPRRDFSASEFSRIVMSVLPCVSCDTHRQVLTAVAVTPSHAVATDTHRLAFLRIADVADMPTVMVPERVWEHIVKALPKRFDGVVMLAPSDSVTTTVTTIDGKAAESTTLRGLYVMAFDGGPTVVFDTLKGGFPNWERVVPNEHTRQWTVDNCELYEAARAVKTVARENANRERFTETETGFVLSGKSDSKGEIEMAVTADSLKLEPGYAIAVNGEYLLQALKAIPTSRVMIRMTECSRPMTLHGVEDDSYVHVIMPMALA